LFLQLNEAELEVDSEKASYKQKLEVLQQQEELIEDEEEQEQKEEDARRAKREADELEALTAQSLLPDSEVVLPLPICNRLLIRLYDRRILAATGES
jgi:LETM1 and EF-hand domain-containing protein 1